MSTKEKTDKAADAMRATVDKLCEMIEQGIADPEAWRKSWQQVTHSLGGAENVATGKPYQGGNAWTLAITEMMGEHRGPWGTYNQWAEVGAQVRKGEKASVVLLRPNPYKRETTEAERAKGAGETVTRMFFKAYVVFGADQVDGWDGATDPVDLTPGDRIEAETWTREVVEAGKVNLMHGEPAARPAAGIVYMPEADAFESLDAYLCTFWHELTHWTAPKVKREMTAKRFGDDAYAAEELVAEMGAAIIAARHGISAEPRVDHANYLAHWLRVLKADPSRLWTAGTAADKAAAYLFDLVPLAGAEVAAEQAVAA